MAFESLEQAAAALAEANVGEAPATESSAEAPVASETAPAEATRTSEQTTEQTTQQVTEGATVEDSFTKVDLNSLIDGLDPEAASRVEQAYKSFQSDYTRKTQEVAPLRKLVEEYGSDPDVLRQSVEFVHNLRTDPNFAVAVHEELSGALQDAGLTEAEAHAEATRQVTEQAYGGDDPYSDFEFDPEDPRDAAIQELMSFRDELMEREQDRELEAQIQRQEMAIRQQNPDYTPEDMEEILKLSFAYGGDLFAAEKDYASLRDRFLQSYVAQKESVQTNQPAPVTPARHAQEPVELDFDAAHKAAKRHLAAVLAQG